MAKGNSQKKLYAKDSGLNFEAQLWAAADKMRAHMDASGYKHVCLGLIFLKYISDAFEKKREQLLFGISDPKSEWFIKDEPQSAEAAEIRERWRIILNVHESRTLAALRDALLPKLLSGELRVPVTTPTEVKA